MTQRTTAGQSLRASRWCRGRSGTSHRARRASGIRCGG
jgi:hypothetical protein